MKKLKVFLENCYGIKKLDYSGINDSNVFDFTKNKTCVIYAPNGTMKTSFANTFMLYSQGGKINNLDRVYPSIKSRVEIKDENDIEINKNEIFVIQSYDSEYKTDKLATLLLNSKIKEDYDVIISEIDAKKKELMSYLSELSGIYSDIDKQMSVDITFRKDGKAFIETIKTLELTIENANPILANINYSKIFNEKTLDAKKGILNDVDFHNKINKYFKKYNELIDGTKFFRKGVFDHQNAEGVLDSLKKNGFFRADHRVFLDGEIQAISEEELKKRIDDERNRVVNDKDLQKIWNEIEKKLNSNAELREFLQYLKQEGNEVIREKLSNQSLFKKELWLAYLSRHKESFLGLLKVYKDNEEKLKKISSRIQEEARDWENAVDKFNDRFCTLPFRLNMENKEDVLLQNEIPSIKFSFDNQPITEKEILKVLSQGEKRALYLLNIIFEVEARKKLQQKTIFIIDDIADSFDYQNKYAIVEYLHDISCENKFYQIILTHNYDFYRTIRSRLLDKGYMDNKCSQLQAIKYKDRIEFICDKYQNNPFDEWKKNLDNKQYLIACIPFLRNLTEYQNGSVNNKYYNELTALLHIKNDTNSITNQKLKDIFKGIIQDKSTSPDKINDLANIVKNDILDVAQDIVTNYNYSLELETKICLSIAIRIVAEDFMIKKINNKNEVDKIKRNQTKGLFKLYKELPNKDIEKEKILEKVNIITPENIHLNSFMYEPIIDMSSDSLVNLYRKVLELK